MRDYPTFQSGEPVLLPNDGGEFTMVCCDCQLAHRVTNEITPEGVVLRVYRDQEQTDSLRLADAKPKDAYEILAQRRREREARRGGNGA